MKTKYINRVREFRDKTGISQRKMAEEIGLTHKGLQKIESGESQPKVDTAIAIASYFGSTVEKIFSQKT